MMSCFYSYLCKDEFEKSILIEYFKPDFDFYNYGHATFTYYYSFKNNKLNRKMKLLSLEDNKLAKRIKKIIKNSVSITGEEYMIASLSSEIAKEIDKEVLKGLKDFF